MNNIVDIKPPVYLRDRHGAVVVLPTNDAVKSQLKSWLDMGAVIIKWEDK